MKYKVVFHPIAEKEYLEAYLWYEDQSPGLGARLEEAVENKLAKICTSPLLYIQRKEGYFGNLRSTHFPIRLFTSYTKMKR